MNVQVNIQDGEDVLSLLCRRVKRIEGDAPLSLSQINGARHVYLVLNLQNDSCATLIEENGWFVIHVHFTDMCMRVAE